MKISSFRPQLEVLEDKLLPGSLLATDSLLQFLTVTPHAEARDLSVTGGRQAPAPGMGLRSTEQSANQTFAHPQPSRSPVSIALIPQAPLKSEPGSGSLPLGYLSDRLSTSLFDSPQSAASRTAPASDHPDMTTAGAGGGLFISDHSRNFAFAIPESTLVGTTRNTGSLDHKFQQDNFTLKMLTYLVEWSTPAREGTGFSLTGTGGGGGGGGGDPPPPLGDHCHSYDMELNSVAFGGDGFSTVYHDLGNPQPAFPSPQWVDTNPRDNKNDDTANTTDLYPNLGLGLSRQLHPGQRAGRHDQL